MEPLIFVPRMGHHPQEGYRIIIVYTENNSIWVISENRALIFPPLGGFKRGNSRSPPLRVPI